MKFQPITARAALLCLALLLLTASSPLAQAAPNADQPVFYRETPLNPIGSAYEANLAPDGTLWVTDNQGGQLLAYSPDGRSLTVYKINDIVWDARTDSSGKVWFNNKSNQTLNQLDPQNAQVRSWTLPFVGDGTAYDNTGVIWISNTNLPKIYSLNPTANNQLCSWEIPLAISGSPYLYFDGTFLWFADFFGSALLRLNPSSRLLEQWKLLNVWNFMAQGLVSDDAGGLWFTDMNSASIGRLDLTTPTTPRLLLYSLPPGFGFDPEDGVAMLARQGTRLYFTVPEPAALGTLDPSSATASIFNLDYDQEIISPACESVSPVTVEVQKDDPTLPDWHQASGSYTLPAAGWRRLAIDDPDSFLWGIAYRDGVLWAVDNGRQVLIRIEQHEVFLPLVKR